MKPVQFIQIAIGTIGLIFLIWGVTSAIRDRMPNDPKTFEGGSPRDPKEWSGRPLTDTNGYSYDHGFDWSTRKLVDQNGNEVIVRHYSVNDGITVPLKDTK